ncbi:MAG: type II toxin-antitoxin system RelB/DinJ family antitoxin [Clostridiales bacterium]|nr:type II toxin-antitoxin system RelB/DinJ family antitoxin [Clostridiales bacterium]
MANVNIRVDDKLKREAEGIFAALGLTMSAATNVFYKQVVRFGGIPFSLRVDPDQFHSTASKAHPDSCDVAMASEAALAKDWLLPEEDTAWADL